jgi:protein YIPF6
MVLAPTFRCRGLANCRRGPLLFSILLSFLLSRGAREAPDAAFSGVFAIIWVGKAIVTLQIRLLGGHV